MMLIKIHDDQSDRDEDHGAEDRSARIAGRIGRPKEQD